ncbi:MAG TPA: GNAT family N-acetyltransferase [Oligoflexia bacterium]|nr:GNAT family N-acetyltransferase [Oligoflexia bacterium]HMP49070.1 GNAT family N-acetyltransferase [Oligoflexia bacterium]
MESFFPILPVIVDGYRFEIRCSSEADRGHAQGLCDLIREASQKADIAIRSQEELLEKINSGMAVLAFRTDEHGLDLIGGAYLKAWDGGQMVTHSALVVKEEYRGFKIGRQIKSLLMEMTQKKFPGASIFSLTTNASVVKMNTSHGFREVGLENGPLDEHFWEGCKGCPNFKGLRDESGNRICCCNAYLWTSGKS